MTFDLKVDEETQAFFKRMSEEHKAFEDAVRERIQQLFDEYVKLGGEKKDEAYVMIRNIFSVGYQLGWNDCFKKMNYEQDNETVLFQRQRG